MKWSLMDSAFLERTCLLVTVGRQSALEKPGAQELNGAEMDSDDLTAESSRYKFGASPRGHGDISRVCSECSAAGLSYFEESEVLSFSWALSLSCCVGGKAA